MFPPFMMSSCNLTSMCCHPASQGGLSQPGSSAPTLVTVSHSLPLGCNGSGGRGSSAPPPGPHRGKGGLPLNPHGDGSGGGEASRLWVTVRVGEELASLPAATGVGAEERVSRLPVPMGGWYPAFHFLQGWERGEVASPRRMREGVFPLPAPMQGRGNPFLAPAGRPVPCLSFPMGLGMGEGVPCLSVPRGLGKRCPPSQFPWAGGESLQGPHTAGSGCPPPSSHGCSGGGGVPPAGPCRGRVGPPPGPHGGEAGGTTLGIRNLGFRTRNKKPYPKLLLPYILVGEMKIEVISLSHNKIKRKFLRPSWNLAETARSLTG